MKNIIYLIIISLITFSNNAQVQEGDNIRFQFLNVEKDKIEEFESYMIEYVGPVAKKAVAEGKMENWLLRKVANNSIYNSDFTHVAVWVATNPEPSWSDIWANTYPNVSEDARSWIYGKGEELYSTLYNAYCEYITGFFREESVIPDVAIFNLIKAKKYNACMEK